MKKLAQGQYGETAMIRFGDREIEMEFIIKHSDSSHAKWQLSSFCNADDEKDRFEFGEAIEFSLSETKKALSDKVKRIKQNGLDWCEASFRWKVA